MVSPHVSSYGLLGTHDESPRSERVNPKDISELKLQITPELNTDPALNYHKAKNEYITPNHSKVKIDFLKRGVFT